MSGAALSTLVPVHGAPLDGVSEFLALWARDLRETNLADSTKRCIGTPRVVVDLS